VIAVTSLVRYARSAATPAVGLRDGDTVVPLADTVAELLRLPLAELRERCARAGSAAATSTQPATRPSGEASVLAPIDGRTEVWAAGVTYERSRAARMTESETSADIYDLVYDAERPELFFKSAAWRVVGPGEPISVRADSEIDVPEPELALVINAHAEIVGYTVCDDVSSRTIEGVNPLYLPQAKIYLGGCALGPRIRPAWEVPDPYALPMRMEIRRGGGVAWSGTASTGQLRRRLDELVRYLFAADAFPDGVVLATGTCLVPDLPFTLADGDIVEIEIGSVGTLTTPVVRGRERMSYLVDRADQR
jgi:2-dehydro-3-deoxy-D-arabinonate dehydratase